MTDQLDARLEFSLKRTGLPEQVADELARLIINDSIRPGDKLPAERHLSERLGVSRTVIREATRVLVAKGLVNVLPGKGTFVQEMTPRNVTEPLSLLLKLNQTADQFRNLCEIRLTLEVDIAGLAAERVSDQDIQQMETSIQKMVEFAGTAEQFVEADLAFHNALAQATHNNLYQVLLSPITDLLLEFRLTAYHYDAQTSISEGLRYHHLLLNAVKAHDASRARQVMREHLNQGQTVLSAARIAVEKSKVQTLKHQA